MAKVSKKFDKGVLLKETTDAATLQGELRVDSASDELKIYLDGAERTVVSEDQIQTLTNKTIDVDNNTVSNIEVDNLKAGVLNTSTSLAGASDTQVPSALATKTYVDNAVAGVDQASEIDYSNATSGLAATDVQAAIDEVDAAVDDLNTLSGVVKNAEDLGTFTGTTIPDSSTIKAALQALETSVETKALASDLSDHLSDAVDAHDASAISSVPSGNLVATDVQGALNELQSDIDTRALNSDLTTHTSASSGVHGVTGSVVGTTDSQTLTNKTLTSPTINGGQVNNVDINLGTASDTQKLVVSKDTFSNLNALTREEGSVYYATDLDKLYVDDGTNLNAVGSGGQGGINHIDNPDFEVDATGWTTYADAAASTPADATGGSPSITFTRSTSSPLRGLASGLLSKAAANEQGEGASYDFTIDTADQSKMLEISFDYTVTANFVDGDMRVYIYDVTNAQVIEPSQRDILANAGQATYRGYFQANSNSTSYRLIFHIATTSALAYDLKVDNVRVGPTTSSSSTVNFDSALTLKGAPGKGSTNTSVYRFNTVSQQRGAAFTFTQSATLGDSITINENGLYHFSLTSALSAAGYIGITKNSTSDVNTEMTTSSINTLCGTFAATGTAVHSCAGVAYLVKGDIIRAVSATGLYVTDQDYHQLFIGKVGIASEASGSTVAFRAYRTTSYQNIASAAQTTVQFNVIETDTAGGFNTGTFTYTIPESGLYQFDTYLYLDNLNTNEKAIIRVLKNGTSFLYKEESTNSSACGIGVSGLSNCNKGDAIIVRIQSSGDASYDVVNSQAASFFSAFKINNPAQIAPTEVVAASYETNAGQTMNNAATTTIIFEDKNFDSHGAMNTSTGEYTIPVSGKYYVSSIFTYSSYSGWATSEFADARLTINRQGAGYSIEAYQIFYPGTGATISVACNVFGLFDLKKGDLVRIQTNHNAGVNIGLDTTASANKISIMLIK